MKKVLILLAAGTLLSGVAAYSATGQTAAKSPAFATAAE